MERCLYIRLRSYDLDYHSTDDRLKGNDKIVGSKCVFFEIERHLHADVIYLPMLIMSKT